VDSANDEFYLATEPSLKDANGKYFVGKRETRSARMSYDKAERERLWKILEETTGAKY